MKKALILSLMLALVCSFAVAKPVWRIGGGLDMPMEDGFSMGFHGIGGVEMPDALAANLGLLITGSYHALPLDTDLFGDDAGSASLIAGLAEIKYGLGKKGGSSKPYLLGGLGFGSFSYSYEMPGVTVLGVTYGGGDFEVSDTNFLISLGGGMDIGTLFIEGRYMINDGGDMLPISVGVKF